MDDLIPILIFGGFFLISGLGTLLAWWGEKRRREAWRSVADRLALAFEEQGGEIDEAYAGLGLFRLGNRRRWKNVLSGETGGVLLRLFDYEYITGSGKNASTHRRTVCIARNALFNAPGRGLPAVSIRPQHGFADAVGRLFGAQDIDFEEDPDFSGAFVVQAEEEGAARALLGREVRLWLVERRRENLHAETGGDAVLLHYGHRLKPDEAERLMGETFELMQRLRRSWEAG
jgi:hypothetical protein